MTPETYEREYEFKELDGETVLYCDGKRIELVDVIVDSFGGGATTKNLDELARS
jgi:hypothetical protein